MILDSRLRGNDNEGGSGAGAGGERGRLLLVHALTGEATRYRLLRRLISVISYQLTVNS